MIRRLSCIAIALVSALWTSAVSAAEIQSSPDRALYPAPANDKLLNTSIYSPALDMFSEKRVELKTIPPPEIVSFAGGVDSELLRIQKNRRNLEASA